jgi:sugar phosphate permease
VSLSKEGGDKMNIGVNPQTVPVAKVIPNARWWRILPAIILVYIAANIDRSNIAFAVAGGMLEELHMDAVAAGMAIGIFFWGYLLLQIPGGHIAEKGSAKKFIAATIVAWGGLATYSGFASSAYEFYVIRFLLGVAEGGMFPAILVIISHWFPSAERARANSVFIISFPLTVILSGPLSGWLIAGYGWRNMFIVEGLLSLALLFIWIPMISDNPSKAKWVSKEEREWIEGKLAEEAEEKKKADALSTAKITNYREVLTDANLWKMSGIYFMISCAFYGLQFWLPTIIKQVLQVNIGVVGWLSALPNIASFCGILFFARLSDKSQNRKKYIIIPYLGVGVCMALSIFTAAFYPWLSFAFLCACGLFWQSGHPAFWAIVPQLFARDVAGGVRGIVNALGNLSGFFAPMLLGYMTREFNRDIGMYILAVLMFVGVAVAWTMPKIIEGKNRSK